MFHFGYNFVFAIVLKRFSSSRNCNYVFRTNFVSFQLKVPCNKPSPYFPSFNLIIWPRYIIVKNALMNLDNFICFFLQMMALIEWNWIWKTYFSIFCHLFALIYKLNFFQFSYFPLNFQFSGGAQFFREWNANICR